MDWYGSYESLQNVMLFMLVLSFMYSVRGSESFKDNSGWPESYWMVVAFYLWLHEVTKPDLHRSDTDWFVPA